MHHLTYSDGGITFIEGRAFWRSKRKLCAFRQLSPIEAESYAPERREELGRLMERVRAAAREVLDVSTEVRELMGNTGKDELYLKPLIHEVLSLAGAFNLDDYVIYVF